MSKLIRPLLMSLVLLSACGGAEKGSSGDVDSASNGGQAPVSQDAEADCAAWLADTPFTGTAAPAVDNV